MVQSIIGPNNVAINMGVLQFFSYQDKITRVKLISNRITAYGTIYRSVVVPGIEDHGPICEIPTRP